MEIGDDLLPENIKLELQEKTANFQIKILEVMGHKPYENLVLNLAKKHNVPNVSTTDDIVNIPILHSHNIHQQIWNEYEKQINTVIPVNYMIVEMGSYYLVVPHDAAVQIMEATKQVEIAENVSSYERERLVVKPLGAKYISFRPLSYNDYLLGKTRHLLLGDEN